MAVKIQDIANRLDLAPSTVSKALNDYPNISAATKARVALAAVEMGYVASAAARSLRRKRSDKIGFSFGYPVPLMSDYVSGIIIGAVSAAEEYGYNLTLYPTVEDQLFQLTQICRAREVDGILLMGRRKMAQTIIPQLQLEEIPFVVVGRRVDDPAVSFVKANDPVGAYAVTEHLIKMGHKRIAFTTRPAMGATSRDRFEGYANALADYQIPLMRELIVETTFSPDSGGRAMNQLLDLDQPPTAVFAIHDLIALDCLRVAQERGLRVPEDIAIAGFDDWRVSLTASPPLTTVQAPLYEIGATAMRALLEKINSPDVESVRASLPVKLDVRQSTRHQRG